MTATSAEQSSGIGQLNKAMTQVDQVTQRNAAAAEELSSTAQEMESQAAALKEQVSYFRLPEDVTSPLPMRQEARPLLPAASAVLPLQPASGKATGQELPRERRERDYVRF